MSSIRDWRGTLIEVGSSVVYGGPVGRSIQQVEGEVVGFTEKGRVNVRIIRRSYTSGSKSVTHVGPDRLTVVTGLPPCEGATQEEEVTRRKRELERRQRDFASHDIGESRQVMVEYSSPTGARTFQRMEWVYPTCSKCGCGYYDGYRAPCPGVQERAA